MFLLQEKVFSFGRAHTTQFLVLSLSPRRRRRLGISLNRLEIFTCREVSRKVLQVSATAGWIRRGNVPRAPLV